MLALAFFSFDTLDLGAVWASRIVGEPLGGAGYRLGVWDLDGDGYDDLVLAEPGVDKVWVLYGPLKGDTLDLLWLSGRYTLIYGPSDDSVGYSFTAGDFDGDGWLDLAVARDRRGPYAVYIIFGPMGERREVDLSHPHDQRVVDFRNFPWSSDAGHVLAAGDLNGDGYDDLVIGAPRASVNYFTNNGEIFIAWGRERWDSTIIVDAWHGVSPAFGGDDSQLLGSGLAVGDFNGDGMEDLAIGWPGYSLVPNAGGVLVLPGADTQWFDTLNLLWEWWPGSKLLVGDQAYAQFGKTLAAGDFNGDGYDDLAVAAPRYRWGEPNSGAVYIVYGPFPETLRTGEDGGFTLITWSWQNAFMGRSLAFGDLDGDGRDELVVAAPLLNWEGRGFAGAAWVLRYPLPDTVDLVKPLFRTPFLVGGDEYKLGEGIAVGDFDADDEAELALGAPWADAFKTRPDAGFVIIVPDLTGQSVWESPAKREFYEVYDPSGRLLYKGKTLPRSLPRGRVLLLLGPSGRRTLLLK